jgi:hypothetical protein
VAAILDFGGHLEFFGNVTWLTGLPVGGFPYPHNTSYVHKLLRFGSKTIFISRMRQPFCFWRPSWIWGNISKNREKRLEIHAKRLNVPSFVQIGPKM